MCGGGGSEQRRGVVGQSSTRVPTRTPPAVGDTFGGGDPAGPAPPHTPPPYLLDLRHDEHTHAQ